MNDLLSMKKVAIVTSTTGEGDLPTNGEDFWVQELSGAGKPASEDSTRLTTRWKILMQ